MAESALLCWMRDHHQNIHLIEYDSLLLCQRSYESFLKFELMRTQGFAAGVELCQSRNLLCVDATEWAQTCNLKHM
jgi:hypothetical protein